MYIIKVKGKKKIPNYIQLRDDNFMLVGYFSFREGRPFRSLDKFGLSGKEKELEKLVEKMPFGKLQKLEI
ncbi:MAG: fructose-6-phosphate aldolase [Cytophagales bacterium]|nr:fructose-6-phosphate aldolase [Cytophagales bacterium]